MFVLHTQQIIIISFLLYKWYSYLSYKNIKTLQNSIHYNIVFLLVFFLWFF